jgi:hypothetical protein
VIAEPGTNVASCPGLIEAEDLEKALAAGFPMTPAELAAAARKFWLEQNARIAESLSLSVSYKSKWFYACFKRRQVLYPMHLNHNVSIVILELWRFNHRLRNWLSRTLSAGRR